MRRIECELQRLALPFRQVRTEVKDLIQNLVGLEINLPTSEVNIPSGRETAFLVVHDAYAPTPALDRLMAAAAPGLTGGRSFSAIDARHAPGNQTSARGTLQVIPIGHRLGCFTQPVEKLLRPLVGSASGMEPHRHLPFPEQVREALAEAKLSTPDELVAAPALGATARGELEDVSHA
jgi:hypothetical protein